MLIYIILATLAISLISLVGILISLKHIKGLLHYFISFAAGTLIAVSFFDLMPHALEELHDSGIHIEKSVIFIAIGIILFFLIEKLIHWHHCGKDHCDEKPTGQVGSWFHTNTRKVSNYDLELACDQIRLYAIKDGLDPDSNEVRNEIRELENAVRMHNKAVKSC